MSLTLIQTWVSGTFRLLEAALDVMKFFDEAAAQGVEATLIVARELTNSGKSYLARWTGKEMVVLELSPAQQRGFGVLPNGLYKELGTRNSLTELPAVHQVTLSDVRFDESGRYDGQKSLRGTAAYAMDEPASRAIVRCALRVQYFRPDMRRQVTGYWHSNTPLVAPSGELRFSFDPFFNKHNPNLLRGPIVLFFQLMTAQNWTSLAGCQQISNVAARVIEST